jgi:hypothetical protein
MKALGNVAVCLYCDRRWVLVAQAGGGQKLVGLRPFVVNDGKMQTPLKLKIAQMLRNTGKYLVADGCSDRDCLDFVDGKIVYNETIKEYTTFLAIGIGNLYIWTTKEFSFRKGFTTVVKQTPEFLDVLKIAVTEAKDAKGLFVGDTVTITVECLEYEPLANEVSFMIQDAFGVVPMVSLTSI